jgi:hypothetical protein
MFKINKDGTWEGIDAEYRNAHGWAAFVWEALIRKYGIAEMREKTYLFGGKDSPIRKMVEAFKPEPDDIGPYANWGFLWHAHQFKIDGEPVLKLRPWEENVLIATYDRYIVKAEDFETFAASLEMFEEALGDGQRVCHLKRMAEDVRKLAKEDPEATGVCWYPMSVAENYWIIGYDEETDESLYYDFSTGTDHKVAPIRGPVRRLAA